MLNLRTYWKLGTKPTQLDVPAAMQGKLTPAAHPLGEPGQVGIFSVTVTGASEEHKPDGYGQTNAPGILVNVKYRAQMTGTPLPDYPASMTTSPNSLTVFLKDDSGRYYHPLSSTYNDTPQSPGESADLEATFFVPDTSSVYYFEVEYSFTPQAQASSLKAFFALK
jgi:hypothetical protein